MALFSLGAQLGLLCMIFWCAYGKKAASGTFFLTEQTNWINLPLSDNHSLLVEYFLGVDGISLPLLCLASLVSCVGVLASWRLTRNPKLYFFWYLLLNGCVMGTFMSLDLFLFFLFFECMLIPTYFLIGMWGGEKRETAALYFFFYTLAGSLMLLTVIIALYALAPVQRDAHFLHTLNIPLLSSNAQIDVLLREEHIAIFGAIHPIAWLLCLLLLTGFAIKTRRSALPHVAAECPRGGAHCHFPLAFRRFAESRRLWHLARGLWPVSPHAPRPLSRGSACWVWWASCMGA